MSRHSFDPEIAKKVGLNAAVIYQNIVWWCERNAVKGRNIHDGNAWTFNSISSFESLFDYLTAKQIRTALDKLEETKLLEVGNFNKDARDRTKWYAVSRDSEAFAHMVNPHLPKRAETFAPEGRPLPDSKPDNKQTPIPPEGADLFSAKELPESRDTTVEKFFEEFWNLYPKNQRKANRKGCLEKFRSICSGRVKTIDRATPEQIVHGLRGYVDSNPDLKFVPAPLAWLNGAKWEAFQGPRETNRYQKIAREWS